MATRGGTSAAIGGTTRIVAVFGDPVEHSLSPRMHNAAFRELGLDYVYVAIRPRDIAKAVRSITTLELAGVNVTIPFKETAVRHVDHISKTVQAIGALNTIRPSGDKLIGENTDASGFADALKANGFRSRGKRCLVIGAGGAARAVVYALLEGGAAEVVIANRTELNAKRLARSFHEPADRLRTCGLDALTDGDFLAARRLVVNSTSVGLDGGSSLPYDVGSTSQDCLHFDLAYGDAPTAFLRRADAAGRPVVDGRTMLVHQGAAAFKLFTGRRAPIEVMAHAIGL